MKKKKRKKRKKKEKKGMGFGYPFMGLGKFVAGRIHQMRSAKSYLAAHRSWSDESPDPTCPRCETGPESF